MRLEWYRQRNNKLLAGVLSSLASQFSWNVWYVRLGFFLATCLPYVGIAALVVYLLAAVLLPYKEDVYAERYGTGPRKRKEAQKIGREWFK